MKITATGYESTIYDFLSVFNCNLSRISNPFRDRCIVQHQPSHPSLSRRPTGSHPMKLTCTMLIQGGPAKVRPTYIFDGSI